MVEFEGERDGCFEMTELQSALSTGDLSRSALKVAHVFSLMGVSLYQEMNEGVDNLDSEDDYVICDGGCGSGAAVEGFLRYLMRCFPNIKERIKAFGLDHKPLPELIPDSDLGICADDQLPTSGANVLPESPMTTFVECDLINMQLEDDSVNLGYSIATLIYIEDALRVLEEAYRVLKPGGKFYFVVPKDYISLFPNLIDIFKVTPGACEVFSFVGDHLRGVLTCVKDVNAGFSGFNYEVAFVSAPFAHGRGVDDPLAHIKIAIYRALRPLEAEVHLSLGQTRRRDKPPEDRFEQFLERLDREANLGQFPLRYRSRDCERFNQFAVDLDAAFDAQDVVALRRALARLTIALITL